MSNSTCVLVALVTMMLVTTSLPHTLDDVRILVADKSKNYSRQFRPVFDQTKPVYVGLYFELVTIQEFDEVREKFSVVGILVQGWNDELMAWDPALYNNMTWFSGEDRHFWHPNMVLINPYNKIAALGQDWDVFRYFADGTVSTASGAVFDSTCSVDVTHYPWDEQVCTLLFSVFGYTGKEVELVSLSPTVATTYFSENGAWDLIDTNSSNIDDSLIAFTLRLRRKPRFVLVNVILPIMFMSFLNMLVFLIPTDSGERISYCLTVLLAIAVFLTLVGDNLPKTSNPMSILSYYLLCVLVISASIVLATIFNLRIYFHDDTKPVPKLLATFVRRLNCNCKKQSQPDYKRHLHDAHPTDVDDEISRPSRNGQDVSARDSGVFMTNGFPNIRNYHGNWRKGDSDERYNYPSRKYMYREDESVGSSETVLSEDDEEKSVTWKDVSHTVDIILFLFFVVSLTITTAVVFAKILNKSDESLTWSF